MKLYLVRRAQDDLAALPELDRERMQKRLEAHARNPDRDIKALYHFAGLYRLRSGKWRALFSVEGGTMIVHRIRHRAEAYRH